MVIGTSKYPHSQLWLQNIAVHNNHCSTTLKPLCILQDAPTFESRFGPDVDYRSRAIREIKTETETFSKSQHN